MLRLIRNVSFVLFAAAVFLTPKGLKAEACLANFGGDGTSAELAEGWCSYNGGQNCNQYCFNDYGTASKGDFFGCTTANYDPSGNHWYSYGNCDCVCAI
jgi:hypothetical protein